jgi:alpha-L-fucosidase 2
MHGLTFLKFIGALVLNISFSFFGNAQQYAAHNLHFDKLATTWDEGIPLGNATLGALIWEKNGQLRFSLDRSDLWDMRPMNGLDLKQFNYEWISNQVKKKDYAVVQQKLDEPYEKEPAPSKIPGAAMMIDTKDWGEVISVNLDIATAVCTVKWKDGATLQTYIHASRPEGWFKITHLNKKFRVTIDPPAYESTNKSGAGSVEGDDLNRLGYKQGIIVNTPNSIIYTQKGWGGFRYRVVVNYMIKGNTVEGRWTIQSANGNNDFAKLNSSKSYDSNFPSHIKWWQTFWSKSALHIPDSLLEKQYYLEMYKFGAAARKDAPPISLQAVWTADNGRLPPWKGDFHHDLNTQLSYWPSYSGNHLEEALGYLNHLDHNKSNYKRYTKLFFNKEGLNVPGVTTLNGTEMGGWIQYSGSPTVSSWLAQHYYLQWRYSLDTGFLKKRAYPWFSDVATFIEMISTKDEKGRRQLPLSSSPEIFNNSLQAWFTENTNYDLALMKFVMQKAAELADVLELKKDAEHWKAVESEFGDYSLSPDDVLMFAPGKPYDESHRHFSNAMAIHPLGLIKWEDGDKAQSIIRNTIKALDSVGPSMWCGYSYSWLANLKARAKDGEGASKALQIFAKAFCLKNSFHVNGDQTKSGYSNFTYRPFTLEGNFAFAAGLQEMLIQSYAGVIEVFPAMPASWKDVSFDSLRAEEAFLVSASMRNGEAVFVKVYAEKGGIAKVKISGGDIKELRLAPGETVTINF